MRDDTRSAADMPEPDSTLFTLQEAADHLGLSAPVLRFYLHKYASALGIPRIGSGEPLLTDDHLTRLRELYDSGVHRAWSSAAHEESGKEAVNSAAPQSEEAPNDLAQDGESAATPTSAEAANVRLLDMTHEWLEEMDQKMDRRLNELSQTVDFLAEENRELQVLLSRILTTLTAPSDRADQTKGSQQSRPAAPSEPLVEAASAANQMDDGYEGDATDADTDDAWTDEPSTAPSDPGEREPSAIRMLTSAHSPDERTYVPVPKIKKDERSLSVVRRNEEAKDWSPVEL